MYLAELRGKLSQKFERMEDVLTSNVFSFFKYSTREVFLKAFLNELGFDVSSEEAREAEFIFWPRFEDNTEPDLLIVVGRYYLLVEAKYFSDFAGETQKTKAQLLREIEGGKLDAKNYDKGFNLIAITADHYRKEDKFRVVPEDVTPNFKWINWQSISAFLYNILESDVGIRKEELSFARDLYDLLDKKNLRDFQGIRIIPTTSTHLNRYDVVFFNSSTAQFRGDFIGFERSLSFDTKITPLSERIFFGGDERMFRSLGQGERLNHIETPMFFKEG